MPTFKERIQEILLREKTIKKEDLDRALEEQKKSGGDLSKILVKLKLINESELTSLLSEGLGMPPIDISRLKIDSAVLKLIPPDVAAKYQVFRSPKWATI
jgi:type IV pilus assembly protein PilB